MKHIVMFSGGIGSWYAAKRVAARFGTDDLTLLFTDVKGRSENPHIGEDEDTYRFIEDAAANVGGELVILNAGKTIWEVFQEKRFLGNSRLASCSHELKQKPARAWIDENCDPAVSVIYLGIDWSEEHRLAAIERNYKPFRAEAPLCEPPYVEKEEMIQAARDEGLKPPRLYSLGFSHNNCGGGCVRAGQAQFKHLLDVMPERFAEWEAQEKAMQEHLGRPVAILSETIGGARRPLPLTVLRERADSQPALIDRFDIGGCGCFLEEEQAED